MSIIEDITCASAHCVSIYVPSDKALSDVIKHMDDEIESHPSSIVKEIIRSVQHLVNVYKCDGRSLIIFMNENIVCILTDRSVVTYGFYIDNKFFIQQDIGNANGVDLNGDKCED